MTTMRRGFAGRLEPPSWVGCHVVTAVSSFQLSRHADRWRCMFISFFSSAKDVLQMRRLWSYNRYICASEFWSVVYLILILKLKGRLNINIVNYNKQNTKHLIV